MTDRRPSSYQVDLIDQLVKGIIGTGEPDTCFQHLKSIANPRGTSGRKEGGQANGGQGNDQVEQISQSSQQ